MTRSPSGVWLERVRHEADPSALSATVFDSGRVAQALTELTRTGIGITEFALGQPSLDEVFLALTGRPSTNDTVEEESA